MSAVILIPFHFNSDSSDEQMRSFNYLPAECQQVREVCDRINRVYLSGLGESVQMFLESLGKLKRAYLTQLEEKVLSLLELETGG
ncbi:hypothetical protein [Aulosira sp. FACHB-615]|uniref:hypothetical protein n=1 Tax=Aulosira sp. FACHB-615 TaxID=2692777 RepID=UPI00168726A7|nr:hypothetical protein [Aulosira sp. FACHB-615]MBD2492089.1 hypothetical protein [Aulosira sp. FACHB-615]